VILEGFVDVIEDNEAIATLGRGDFFGENNFMEGKYTGIESLGELKASTEVKMILLGNEYFYRIPTFELLKLKEMTGRHSKVE
jgi:hypothetical protein